jgi:cell wall-associated NlpC family hydrolase
MANNRVSGLSDDHAAHARKLIVKAAHAMVANKGSVHYSQRPDRWAGIDKKLTISKGQYPKTCDCSSTHTWMLWDAIHRTYGVRDLVNGQNWKAGYTGTMYKRGKAVLHDRNLKVGDAIFYGYQGGGIPSHVATYIGGGKVFSHGSEGGPYILGIDYRSDRRMSRRYI